VRRVKAAHAVWERDRVIAKAVLAGVPSKDLAGQYGLSQGYIRKVWHRHAASLNPTPTQIPTVSSKGATREADN
jgi:hypothetical protein